MYIKKFECKGAIVNAVRYSLLNGPNQDVSAVKKLETTERTYEICMVKTTVNMLDWCKIYPFYHYFHELKLTYRLQFQRSLSKK